MVKRWVDFDVIKQKANVQTVLEQLGFYDQLEARGENLVGACMLGDKPHGKQDSFNFSVEKKTFKCFACGKKGSVIDFVMQGLSQHRYQTRHRI